MRILITGSTGMVGRALVAHCESLGDEVLAFDRASLNIAEEEDVRRLFERDKPEVVINCAAWTDVDGCEFDSARAFAANARGPEVLARTSRRINAGFVTISTDYVFDGCKEGFYTQRDDPNPQSVYARSKLEGEHLAQLASARTTIVRTGFIFGPGGRNFLSTVLTRANAGERLAAISDAMGTPTYALDLACQLRRLASLDLPGIYHVVNAGDGATYEEIARCMVEEAEIEAHLTSITMDKVKRPAPRPRNSRLKCLISERLGLPPLPPWREAIRDFVAWPQRADSCTAENSP